MEGCGKSSTQQKSRGRQGSNFLRSSRLAILVKIFVNFKVAGVREVSTVLSI